MNHKKNKFAIILTWAIALTTLVIQAYLNYGNFKVNEQHIHHEIFNSFNDAVEIHYLESSKNKQLTVISLDEKENDDSTLLRDSILTTIIKKIDTSTSELNLNPISPIFKDSTISIIQGKQNKRKRDSIEQFTNQITIEIHQETVDFIALDSIFKNLLETKNINSNYRIIHLKNDTIFSEYGNLTSNIDPETFSSDSELIPPNQDLKLFFTNPTISIFKRGLIGLLISFFLLCSLLYLLWYLNKIIRKQKDLAEVKNDLINNISHEFRTPIATTLAALEGISSFNENNDPVKNSKYLQVSKEQLLKLNTMVEKLLETATYDSNDLELKKAKINILPIIDKLIENHQKNSSQKTILKCFEVDSAVLEIDDFHFENAINNLIDNAMKYGGDTITITIKKVDTKINILVNDNGEGIPPKYKTQVFNKFYRIPSGNIHEVKGYGIGLYYSKNVIEKHNGTLTLSTNKSKGTEFKISI